MRMWSLTRIYPLCLDLGTVRRSSDLVCGDFTLASPGDEAIIVNRHRSCPVGGVRTHVCIRTGVLDGHYHAPSNQRTCPQS